MAIRININTLKEGSQLLEFSSDTKELGLDENLTNHEIRIRLGLNKTSDQLDIRANVSGKMNLICDRCLESFDKNFESSIELVYAQRHRREEKIDDDYFRTYDASHRTIDITNDLKETVLLSVPFKKLPDENEKGECTVCKKNHDYWKQFITNIDE